MLLPVLKAISLIIVGVSSLIAGQLVARASDNEGEQRELVEIRSQECSNEPSDDSGDSPQQLRKDNCPQ